MSAREVNSLEVMQRLKEKNLSQGEAAKKVGVNVRHVRRLYNAHLEKGAEGLVSQRRGRVSNNRLADHYQDIQGTQILQHYKQLIRTYIIPNLCEIKVRDLHPENIQTF